jgi:hypothetical protein
VNDRFALGTRSPVEDRVSGEPLHGEMKIERADKISEHEGGSDQERSDARAPDFKS